MMVADERARLPEVRWRLFQLAWPSILSEISTPILGIVDSFVVGHFSDPHDLSGVALAIAVYNPLLFTFNFLRMGTGGVTAQAFGARDERELLACAIRGIAMGLLIGTALSLLQTPLAQLGFALIRPPDTGTAAQAEAYFRCRIVGAPAALANMAVQAWLLGIQRPGLALAQNLLLNVSNAILCVIFGWALGFGVAGVGAATALANYIAFAVGLGLICRSARQLPWMVEAGTCCQRDLAIDWAAVFEGRKLASMAVLNFHIFGRCLCMVSISAGFMAFSAGLGSIALAANSLLMQLQQLLSFGADGFANAAEAMVGEAVGGGNVRRVRVVLFAALQWGCAVSLVYTLAYALCGRSFLRALTSHVEVVDYAMAYLAWQWASPMLSVTAYLMDGIFVGATCPREMCQATFLAMLVFFSVAHATQGSNNWLWGAYLIHVVVRAAVLLLFYPRIERSCELEYGRSLLRPREDSGAQ